LRAGLVPAGLDPKISLEQLEAAAQARSFSTVARLPSRWAAAATTPWRPKTAETEAELNLIISGQEVSVQ
jgi:hypothetical protein